MKRSVNPSNVRIRFAVQDDIPVILNFIKQLAIYEKLEHEVTADEQILNESLFGTRPVAEVILAETETQAVGFALFFHSFSTFLGKPGIYLEDVFVMPESRGQGIGKTILSFLASLAVERNCGRLEWSVLDWNTPAIEFYKNLGAIPMDDWTVFRVSGDTLLGLAGPSG